MGTITLNRVEDSVGYHYSLPAETRTWINSTFDLNLTPRSKVTIHHQESGHEAFSKDNPKYNALTQILTCMSAEQLAPYTIHIQDPVSGSLVETWTLAWK